MGLVNESDNNGWAKVNIAPEDQPPHYIEVKPTLHVDEAIKQPGYARKVVEALSKEN